MSSVRASGTKNWGKLGGSPGLVVMRDDSCSIGRGFESQHQMILDGHFLILICGKNCTVCLFVCFKRPKINEKEAGWGNFFKKRIVINLAPEFFPVVQLGGAKRGRVPSPFLFMPRRWSSSFHGGLHQNGFYHQTTWVSADSRNTHGLWMN